MFVSLFPIISPVVFIIVVAILGYITPGYNHLNHTVSRLAIEKYGWIQSINFLQLAIAIEILGQTFAHSLTEKSSKVAVRLMFSLSAFLLSVAAVVPTDPIENIPLRLSIYTPLGLIHAGAVILFLAASPVGIHRLGSILAADATYARYTTFTRALGYMLFTASILWLLSFVLGFGLSYRGITQKMIICAMLGWITFMGYLVHTHTPRNKHV